MNKSYVLETIVKGSKVYFDRLSIYGCPLNDELKCAKRFTQLEAVKMALRLNAVLRGFPEFKEDWLYKIVAI